jgi:hypothetical protein
MIGLISQAPRRGSRYSADARSLAVSVITRLAIVSETLGASDMNQKFPHIKVRLFAKDNPIAILGRTIKAMRSAGVEQAEINRYTEEATSGDYNKLLAVTAQWVSTY